MTARLRKRMLVLSVFVLVMLVGATACDPEVLGLYVSMVKSGVTDDGLAYDTNDILFIYPDDAVPQWYKIFDGDAVGLNQKHNIQAFSFNELIFNETFSTTAGVNDEGSMQLYLAFSQTQIKVPGITGNVYGQDIVEFDGYYTDGDWSDYGFTPYFDGSDVGLTTKGEKLDGISVWPPEYYDVLAEDIELPYDCNAGVLFLTTQGSYRVPNNQGGFLIGDGSDVLLFCATNLGTDTAGFWFRAFDGSDAGFQPRNAGFGVDVWAVENLAIDEDSGDLQDFNILFWFTPKKYFSNYCGEGYPSDLMVGGVIDENPPTEGDCAIGPFANLQDGWTDSGNTFPGTGGVVDSVGVFDWPFTTP